MSKKTKFKGTMRVLFERERLHQLVDFFWQNLDYTRDSVYEMIARALGSTETIHISDMSHAQMRAVAERFQDILLERGLAPCSNCRFSGKRDKLGMIPCLHQGSKGFFWLDPENEIQPRSCTYVKSTRSGDN